MENDMKLQDVLKDYIVDCEVRRLSPKTVSGYYKLLRMFLLWIGNEYKVDAVSGLTTTHLKQYILFKEKSGARPNYLNDILKVLRNFCHYMYDEGIADRVYTDRIHNVKQSKVKIISFNEAEIKGMVGYYSGKDFLAVRNKLMISMFFDTGMRCNELITLKESNVGRGVIMIHGKGDKERTVPFSPFVEKMLCPYYEARDRYFYYKKLDVENVFISKNGRPMTNEGIRKILLEAAGEIGVRNTVRVSPHTMRHTFAHTQLRNGCDIYTLSRLLGHESVSITQRYLNGIEDEQILKVGLIHCPLMNIKGIK